MSRCTIPAPCAAASALAVCRAMSRASPIDNFFSRKTIAQRHPFDKFGNDKISAAPFADFVNRDDVRMIQSGCRKGFLPKTADAVFVFGDPGGKQFESDGAIQPRVFRQINFAHSALADLLDNFIMPDALTAFGFFVLTDNLTGNFTDGGRFHKTFRVVKRSQKRFDLAARVFIIGANFIEKTRTLAGRDFYRVAENPFRFFPIVVFHLVNSRCSQAFAIAQSVATVVREIFNASAVSSKVKPLK